MTKKPYDMNDVFKSQNALQKLSELHQSLTENCCDENQPVLISAQSLENKDKPSKRSPLFSYKIKENKE